MKDTRSHLLVVHAIAVLVDDACPAGALHLKSAWRRGDALRAPNARHLCHKAGHRLACNAPGHAGWAARRVYG
eukprot:283310-Chlamydomonas_euryale.AAC.14